jgi:hypothetical protein
MNSKQTKTGDIVQLNECNDNDATYGIISIKLKKAFAQLQQAQTVLIEFIEQLQSTFGVLHTTGLHAEWESTKVSVTDYWQDADGQDWKVKGWTDGKTIAVFYIKNIARVPVARESYFLNGAYHTRP